MLEKLLSDVRRYGFIALAVLIFFALVQYLLQMPESSEGFWTGALGYGFASVSYQFFGWSSLFWPLILVLLSRQYVETEDELPLPMRVFGFIALIIGLSVLLSFFSDSVSGVIGAQLHHTFADWIGELGVAIATVLMVIVGLNTAFGVSLNTLAVRTGESLWTLAKKARVRATDESLNEEGQYEIIIHDEKPEKKERKMPSLTLPKPKPKLEEEKSSVEIGEKAESVSKSQMKKAIKASNKQAQLPALSLLDEIKVQTKGYDKSQLESMSRSLEQNLNDFGINAGVVEVQPGPVVTRFELQPAPGVKVSQIANLAKDLARAMSVHSVRIVEVIPGKPYIGVEIPNEEREMVGFQEILASDEYQNSDAPLSMALGKDISGKPVVVDLAKTPHLLVAGTTGSGKSVGVNAMILSMLYKSTPEQVRLIMVDPKMLELSIYEDIPHLLSPVVTDMNDASNALRWCVAEMERRYQLLAKLGVRNIKGYNDKIIAARKAGEPIKDPLFKPNPNYGHELGETAPELETMEYIVVVIDEFADMMMTVGKKVEELIARLAQKARAAGIHLILATQRPSVNVITGLIKANIPTRMSFQVSTKVDSRTILDQMGAEQLLGQGDMLYLAPGSGAPTRVHGAFVSDAEVHRVVEFLKSTSKPNYIETVTHEQTASEALLPGEAPAGSNDVDPLFDQAIDFVARSRKASISSVQRHLRVGYNRAARMVEEMEAQGIISPVNDKGQREVLAPKPQD